MTKETFVWDYAEVAAWMCWEWKLSESLASKIGGHNQPEENCQYERLAAVFLISFI
jgi:hypothetical protein|tara:strand:- start:316 stop:483 length:168 start_codon:yes stop_codon:yes gene_type:complete